MSGCGNSAKGTPISVQRTGHKNPVVLSSQRYNKLLSNANQSEKLRAQQEADDDRQYREYLKNGSDNLVTHFKGNMPRTQDSKLEEMKRQMEYKQKRAEDGIKQAKESEEIKRRENIVKAQQLMEKLKPGPRSLHAAAMHSEILRVRNVQRDISLEFEKAVKKQECADKAACEQQALPWIQEEQVRLAERQMRTDNYKHELLQTINETRKQRADMKQQELKRQRGNREALDMEIKAQIDKEKAHMEKRRVTQRKTAVEAMKMVEQRRQRESMAAEVENRLCCIYNTGKKQLDKLKTEHVQQTAAAREAACDANAKYTAAIKPDVLQIEANRLRRDISRMELQFTAEEREKIRKNKAAKYVRIEEYLRELQQQKEQKARADEMRRFEMAQRFKNTEVNCLFNVSQQQEYMRQRQYVRTVLEKQMEENRRAAERERASAMLCNDDDTKQEENRHFFKVARWLFAEAQQKKRPIYPLTKAVQQYKRDNQIGGERKTPKHLVSQVGIGCCQPSGSKLNVMELNADHMQPQCLTNEKMAETEKDPMQNCRKGREILGRSAGSQIKCPPDCPFAKSHLPDSVAARAFKQPKAYQCPMCAECAVCAVCPKCAESAVCGECAQLLSRSRSSVRVRYSVEQLKKLNSATEI